VLRGSNFFVKDSNLMSKSLVLVSTSNSRYVSLVVSHLLIDIR
jgi:hypothetical protein